MNQDMTTFPGVHQQVGYVLRAVFLLKQIFPLRLSTVVDQADLSIA